MALSIYLKTPAPQISFHRGYTLPADDGIYQTRDEKKSHVPPHLKAAILEVVENQLRENNPPETRQTFERLLAAGYSRQRAMEMIGAALVEEIWTILHEKKQFDHARFVELLGKLG